jgi:anti-anti-sigma factor
VPEPFSIREEETRPGAVVLRVVGQLDARSTPQLIEYSTRIRRLGKSLVLNLAQVDFIASSGIGGLLSLAEDFKEAELGLRFAALSSAVESVIQLLNLDQFLAIDASESAAFAALESR